jgi:Ca2+-binding EF-hand superfamily protein
MKKKGVSPHDVFAKFDVNKDGTLDIGEFTNMVKFLGLMYTNEKIDEAFRCIDTDGNGMLSADEFVDVVNWQ